MSTELEAIGLFGGTFDPVHNGHIALINSFLGSNYLNELWVVLTPEPPHKENTGLSSFKHRKIMLEQALGNKENVHISTIENELPKPSYTLNTVQFFSKRYPHAKLYLCIGEDSLSNFQSWYRWQDILSLCTLLVARRPGVSDGQLPEKLARKACFVEHNEVDISSTAIRIRIRSGEKVDGMVPHKVLSYIEHHHLYKN